MRRLLLLGLVPVLAFPAAAARLPIIASQDWWPVFSPDGHDVAFTRIQQRTMTLEVVDLVTGRVVRVAAGQGQLGPSWSSDGRLAFSLGGRVYTANADGSDRVAVGRGYAPAWRPRSADVAYVTGDLWVGRTRWAQGAIGHPAWSPDGSRLAFQRDDGLYVTSGPASDQLVVRAPNPGGPAWSPDGTTIAYAAGGRIWTAPADGSGEPRPLTPPLQSLGAPSWSREGDAVTFTAQDAVWVAYLDTGRTAELIGDGRTGAAFSPVGDVVAFSGARPGCPGHSAIRIYLDNERNGPVTGTCEIRGTAGEDVLDGTSEGGDVILAGAGSDRVHARNGRRDTVDCGPGQDTVWADSVDVLRGCEIVHRA